MSSSRQPLRRLALTFLMASGSSWWVAVIAPQGNAQPLQLRGRNVPGFAADADDLHGVYLPANRTMSRGILRARERLAEGEYHEALEFLQQVLEQQEDSFLETTGDADAGRGLKALARQMIADLPPPGRETYQMLHASAARRQLEAALAAGGRQELAKLVRQYSSTSAGFDAALVLAQIEFDRGHPLAAVHLYERLQQDPHAAAQFEPQLSLLTAVSWAAAGQPDRAAATLRRVAKRFASATIVAAGREHNLPPASSSDEDLLAWLSRVAGPLRTVDTTSLDWPTQRGNPQRNTDHGGGAPHLRARWQARVVNDPRIEAFLASRRHQLQQHGTVTIPAARPLAIGNVVLMRTPRNVVAVDWQSGKRIWETRDDEEQAWDRTLADVVSRDEQEDWTSLSHPLEQRMWDDALTTSLGSDGRLVFVLSGSAAAPPQESVAWGMNPVFQGPMDANLTPTNRLSAYELATEGKLAWEIDGDHAPGALKGAFFLGPPLAVGDTLFVLAEVQSAIYLLALEPASGQLLWRQQLAGLEQSILLDPQRRLQGTTPSYDAGILVCPTGSGMVVGIDVVGREFAWVYWYARRVDSALQLQQAWQVRGENVFVRADRGWLDGSVVVAEGRVFLTPPESTELHCLDLKSGKLLWKQQRDQSAFLACVDRGTVLLVGSQTVSAVRTDGTPAWSDRRVNLPGGAMPAGLGYLSRGAYFLPLSTGQVLPIDVASGNSDKLTSLPNGSALGNLVCHRGSVLSQSDLFLDKFEQFDVIRERAETTLAKNPRDAAAIRDLAEIRRSVGALDEAVRMLEQAFAIDPDDLVTREMLSESLLEALAADFRRYRDRIPLLQRLITEPAGRISLLRIEAQGLQASGELIEAFQAYVRLAEAARLEPQPLAISAVQTVRSDCWIRGRLAALLADAPSDERRAMLRQLDELREAWTEPPAVGALRRFLDYFGGLPGTDAARFELVSQLVERGEPLEAEIELLKLEQSSDPQYQAAAAVAMTNWLIAANRLPEARRAAEVVRQRWPDSPALDDRTGREWFDQWATRWADDGDSLASGNWPRGQVSVELAPAVADRPATRRARVQFQSALRRLRVEQTYRPRLGPSQWLVAEDGNRLEGRDALGQDLFRFGGGRNAAMPQFPGRSDWIQAAQLGDVLYVTFAGQIVALDAGRVGVDREENVLWRAYPAGRFPVGPMRLSRRAAQNFYHAWSDRQRMPKPARTFLGGLGPISPFGVVIQEQDQLRRVDPLTGETLWSRSDVPPGCELFGDEEYLLAADADDSTIRVIRVMDGELVDRRNFSTTSWLLTAGRNVALLNDSRTDRGPRKSLRVVDAVSGRTLLTADYAPTARMATLEPQSIAIVEPPGNLPLAVNLGLAVFHWPMLANVELGRFQLVDVRAGKLQIDQPLQVVANLRRIEVLQAGDELFLMLDGQSRRQASSYIGLDYPLVNGLVYAFDRERGTMAWPGPALIDNRGITLMQPDDVPLLVFVDRQSTRDTTSDRRSQLRLLCLDKRTGATIYRNDALPDTAGGQFRVRADRAEPPTVTIEMSAWTLRLSYSDSPRPPEPPANDRVEAPRKTTGGGLLGVAERMGAAIQGAIENPAGTKWNLPPSERKVPRGSPARENAIDDD